MRLLRRRLHPALIPLVVLVAAWLLHDESFVARGLDGFEERASLVNATDLPSP